MARHRLVAPMTTSLKPRVRPVDIGDRRIHRAVYAADFPTVATRLRALLGNRLVAYIGGVTEGRAVNEWAEGTRVPAADTQRRLRVALQVASVIEHEDGAEVAQAWFQGLDPRLGDRAPATILRAGDPDDVGPRLLESARSFIEA